MEINKGFYAVVDPIHIFNSKDLTIKESLLSKKIYVVKNPNNQLFYLIKKGENFINSSSKYSFITYLEKSIELIHPALINLSGFSIQKPYLYYQCSQKFYSINNIKLSDDNVQKILIGIASGLAYLVSKGYYYPNFSIDTIIIDQKSCPKLIDYIDYEDSNKGTEKDLIIKYVDIVKTIIDKKSRNESKNIVLNAKLNSLIEKCKNGTNVPTFNDFIQFFKVTPFHGDDEDLVKLASYLRYLEILHLRDRIKFDDLKSINFDDNYKEFNSIEQICYHFLRNKDMEVLTDDDIYLLNSLPEYQIKSLVRFVRPLKKKLIRYLYNEDVSLIIPNWQKLCNTYSKENPFLIYKELMKKMKSIEKKKDQLFYFDLERKDADYKIDALRIQAIHFLKKAHGQKHIEAQIELAVQYVKGYILPLDLQKALKILDMIDIKSSKIKRETKTLINQMKEKIKLTQNNLQTSIENAMTQFDIKQKDILTKANQDHILSMLYVGFAFGTGFNGFPVLNSLSISYYKKAAKLSPDAMALLGFMYFKGIFFPHNLKRARKYFKLAAQQGCVKAEIIDSIIRRHVWRSYLVDFDINELFNYYLQSMIQNDQFQFPKIIYFLENNFHVYSLFKLVLKRENDDLKSDKTYYNRSTSVLSDQIDMWDRKVYNAYSERVLLCSNKVEDTDDIKTLMSLAMSYYYGENDFPVNYKKSLSFYKKAADKGNSEAQWRYAMLCYNSIGNDQDHVDYYLKESSKQKNPKGKLFYGLFIKKENKNLSFEIDDKYSQDSTNVNKNYSQIDDNIVDYEIISDSYCISKKRLIKKERNNLNGNICIEFLKEISQNRDIDGMYYYAMILENKEYIKANKTDLTIPIKLYRKGAKLGHFNSLIRLNNLYSIEYKEIIELFFFYTSGIFNEKYLVKQINYFDSNHKFEQSNILIQIGIRLNPQLFNLYYAKHLLYGKGIDQNIEKAKKLVLLAFNENYPYIYREKYIYLMLQVLAVNKEYENALGFLFKHKKELKEKYSYHFHQFYKRFPKQLAQKYFIPACFCYDGYAECHDALMEYHNRNKNLLSTFNQILAYAKQNNPFAMAILGKAYKMGKFIIRNLETSIQYSARSADLKCPLGYYYIAKEYFYGRYIDQNYKKALEFFKLAFQNNGEPRAGYYIFLISVYLNNYNEDIEKFLRIGAEFKHKRALFWYGLFLIKGHDKLKIQKNNEKGLLMVLESLKLGYRKAVFYYFTKRKFRKSIKDRNKKECDENLQQEPVNTQAILDDNNDESNSFGLINLHEDAKSSDVVLTRKHGKSSESISLSSSFYLYEDDNKTTDLYSDKEGLKASKNGSKISIKEDNRKNSNLSVNEDDDSLYDLDAFWV